MVFGHNSNIKVGAATLHVQTEDRGVNHALIDTTVYFQGRVLHRRTNNYFDLLPLNADSEQALKLRVDEQHRTVLEEIRDGVLPVNLTLPAAPKPATPPPSEAASKAQEAVPLHLELLNARSWLSNRQARLLVSVKDPAGQAVVAAQVEARITGTSGPAHAGQTGSEGQVTIAFEMTQPVPPDAALEITAQHGARSGHLRFALRAKPKVPAAS